MKRVAPFLTTLIAAATLSLSGATAQDKQDQIAQSVETPKRAPIVVDVPPPAPRHYWRDPDNAAEAATQKRFDLAQTMSLAECEKGSGKSCELAGEIFRLGYNGTKDLDRAIDLYERGCELGNLSSCNTFAIAVYDRDPNAATTPQMTQLQVDACDQGYALGCSNAGWRFEKGIGVAVDQTQARALYMKACEFQSDTGCRNAAIAFERPIGGAQDYARALEYYRTACELGDLDGCYWIHGYQELGRAGPIDLATAVAGFSRLCELGHAKSCASFGWGLSKGKGVAKDGARARIIHRKSCDLGYADGCNLLGVLHENGEGGKRDKKFALTLFREACDKDSAGGCYNASRLLFKPKKTRDLAIKLLVKSCDLGQPQACRDLGRT